jgi:hypothetical protein
MNDQQHGGYQQQAVYEDRLEARERRDEVSLWSVFPSARPVLPSLILANSGYVRGQGPRRGATSRFAMRQRGRAGVGGVPPSFLGWIIKELVITS